MNAARADEPDYLKKYDLPFSKSREYLRAYPADFYHEAMFIRFQTVKPSIAERVLYANRNTASAQTRPVND